MEDILDDAEDQSIVVAMDLYGTLVNPASISKALAQALGTGDDKVQQVNTTWRKYQLEYTWRLNSMGTYKPFHEVTKLALQHALKEHSLTLPASKITSLINSYNNLDSFPDVASTIETLAKNRHIRPLIFSNGTAAMTKTTTETVKELALFSTSIPEPICTVDDIEKYKPHPMCYEYLAAKAGKGMQGVGEIVLVSGNPFDICGASEAGLKTCWVDRQGTGWQDGLGAPLWIVKSLEELPVLVEGLLKEHGWGQKEEAEAATSLLGKDEETVEKV